MGRVRYYNGQINANVINNEMKKGLYALRNLKTEDIYVISWKGHKIDALPFIFTATNWFSAEFKTRLSGLLSAITEEYKFTDSDELYDGCDFDYKVFDALPPSQTYVGLRELCVHIHKTHALDLACLIFRAVTDIVREYIFKNDSGCINFKCQGVANTQAFCFHLSLYWFFNLCPSLKALLGKELKFMNLTGRIKSFMPDDCIHDLYLRGEITSEELVCRYLSQAEFGDGSSIFYREIYSINTDGLYTGSPFDEQMLMMASNLAGTYFDDVVVKFNEFYCMYSSIGRDTDTLKKQIKDLESKCEILNENNTKLTSKLKLSRDECNDLKKNLSEVQNECADLKTELSSIKTSEELEKEIDSLKLTLKDKDLESSRLFNERLELKRIISLQKKQIKRLIASLDEDCDYDTEILEENIESDGFDFEATIEKLKDKKLVFVGYDFNSSFIQNLNQLGIKNTSSISRNTKSAGNCDFVVVFTNRCHHTDVYKAEKLTRGSKTKLIYFNSSNVNQLIELLSYELEDNE